jgi:hypothetical protein
MNLFKKNKDNHISYLFSIINNYLINQEQKIKILEKYSDEEINGKNDDGEGIIFMSIKNNEEKMFDYLLKRNIDLDYYTFINTDNPLIFALYNDILNNRFAYSKKILEKVKLSNNTFYREINKFANNIAHSIISIRTNRNIQNLFANNSKSPNYLPDFEILKLIDNYSWNQNNNEKITPLNLITKLDFDIYSKLFDKNKIQISPHIFNTIEQEIKDYEPNSNIMKWKKFLKSLPEYKDDISTINFIEEEYVHSNLFQATFKDLGIYSIYLADTYKDLLIPNMNSYLLKNLTFENSYPLLDKIVTKEQIFPWIISYYSQNNYIIHPYLNNIINGTRRNNKKRYAVVFICIMTDSMLHANVLLYDFKNMTIERFEPYGNSTLVDNSLDKVLEEELTWNTGLKYLKPDNFLPWAGFQTISDETNLINKKAGDFGFCTAWCLWYIETKLKNQNVDSKILVSKLINKIIKLDIQFIEYIRNYSNKINKIRIKYLKDIGIDTKSISNIKLSIDSNIKLTNYLIMKFSNLKNANQLNELND